VRIYIYIYIYICVCVCGWVGGCVCETYALTLCLSHEFGEDFCYQFNQNYFRISKNQKAHTTFSFLSCYYDATNVVTFFSESENITLL
jgi:hypothetical protein